LPVSLAKAHCECLNRFSNCPKKRTIQRMDPLDDDADRLRAIIECQRQIMACGPDRDRVMRLITERTQALTCASSSIIELREGDHMVYRAASGTAASAVGSRLSVYSSLSGSTVLDGRMVYCRDSELDARVDLETCRRFGLRSMVVMPLHHGKAVIGVLKVASPVASGFTDEHIATLELMSGFLSAALAHASEHEHAQRAAEMFESAFSRAAVGMALVGLDGRWLRVNDALCTMLGYSRPGLLQIDFQTLTHPEDLGEDLQLLSRLSCGEIPSYEMDKRYLHRDGHLVYVHLGVSLVRDAAGAPLFFVSQIQDVTRGKLAESEVQAFFGMSPNLLAILGPDATFERVNPAWTRLFGWTNEELTTKSFLEFIHPDDQAATLREVELIGGTGSNSMGFRSRCRTIDGSYRWLEWNTRSTGGRTYCDARDVSAQVEHELRELSSSRALAESELRFRALSEGSIQGIVVAEPSGEKLLYVNDAAARLFGFASSPDMRERATLFSLMPHHSRRLLADDWEPFVAGQRQSIRARIELQRIDGSPLWVDLVGSLISWDGERALQTVMIDASAQVALEQALSKQATTDALTGLFNRRQFERMAIDAIATAESDGSALCLLMLDLDHFKSINDQHGHAGGDEALRTFARLLEATLSTRGLFARWGGEEFVALLPDTGLAAAALVAEQVRALWSAAELRFESAVFHATVSIGMSEKRAGERRFSDMLERADRALYEAKRCGRNTIRPVLASTALAAPHEVTTSRA
jgi:diguanylate cyclase (GGDEF)-like protein/PAS domain S-box-containing protein